MSYKPIGSFDALRKAGGGQDLQVYSGSTQDEPAYKTEKIDGKWYVIRRGEVASQGLTTKQDAERELILRMESDLRYLTKAGELNTRQF